MCEYVIYMYIYIHNICACICIPNAYFRLDGIVWIWNRVPPAPRDSFRWRPSTWAPGLLGVVRGRLRPQASSSKGPA